MFSVFGPTALAALNCGTKYVPSQDGINCMLMADFPVYIVGKDIRNAAGEVDGDVESDMLFKNSSPIDKVGYNALFVEQKGLKAKDPQPGYTTVNGGKPTPGSITYGYIAPGGEVTLNALYQAAGDTNGTNCAPVSGQVKVGSIRVILFSPNTAVLDAQLDDFYQLIVRYIPKDSKKKGWKFTPQLVRESSGLADAVISYTQSSDALSNATSVNILNVDIPQSLEVTVLDSNMKQIGKPFFTTVLDTNELLSITLVSMFKMSMFPDGFVGDFNGKVRVRGTGKIIVLGFQVIDGFTLISLNPVPTPTI